MNSALAQKIFERCDDCSHGGKRADKHKAYYSNGDNNIRGIYSGNIFNMNCDILTARGFSSVTNILGVTEGIKIQKKMLLLKGKNYEKEIIEAQKHWVFDFNLHNSITSQEGKIVEIFNIKKLL